MDSYKRFSFYIFFVLVAVALLPACSGYKAVTLESKLVIPDTFTHVKDTGNTATSARQFFTDTYLQQLLDTAIKANPDVLSALQRVEVASANLRSQGAYLLPSVNLNANAGLEKYGDYTMNGVGNYDTNFSNNINSDQKIPNPTPDYFLGFRSTWELDIWGKLRERKKAAFTRVLASQSGYRMVVTSLVAQLATSYYQLLALDYELKVIRKNITLQNHALEIVRIQKLGGRATELAVQQFLAQLKRTQSLEYQTLQQITETENMINFLRGRFNGKVDRDTSINILKLPGIVRTGVPSQLLLNRPDIRESELQLKAYNADISAARKAFLPTVNLTAYTGYNAFASALLFNPGSFAYGIIGGLTAPIFNRGQLKADYQRTLAEGQQALYTYQKNILNGYMEVMNTLKGVENFQKYYDQKRQEVDALNNAVSVANDLYLVGRANYLEVITAQRNVLDAELELANTRRNIFINSVNLYRSLGGGWR
ncbi:efflux transporter outer membrane subunit [Mucilaginibacter sp. RS28]|uniref:Efflux transporter outer membrane subunit n=1 Tax=Mucilaginibacter straminoryzae TaxID=2932774 RepID=A0A9X1X518_9SPHI|nr:efflux transporter outer membrane subunit [Mucilaginibacter straminoryzae]MCJ8211073.1 efflux transporter outer membrane subunit [Mucilaginibacter straminoryzae]